MDMSENQIDKLLTGPLLISTVLNWGLFGVLSVQVFLFFQAFPNDRFIFKVMVYGIYLLEMAQTIAMTVAAWATFVKNFGNGVDSVPIFTTMSTTICLLETIVAMVVQTFYAYRIMIISENKIVPSFIVLMSITSFIAEVVVAVIIGRAENFEIVQLHTLRTSDFIGIWLGTSCACDILIAVYMWFYLNRRIRDGIFPKTQALVSRMMRKTIETGALTASVSIVAFALFYAPTLDGFTYYATIISVLSKLYSNTMLALLNSRIKLGMISDSTTWQDNELPHIPLSHPQRAGGTEIRFASFSPSKNEVFVVPSDEVIMNEA